MKALCPGVLQTSPMSQTGRIWCNIADCRRPVQRCIGHAATHVPMCVIRLGFSQGKHRTVPNYGVFFNEIYSLAYFEILEELSSGLSLTVNIFKIFDFPLSLVGFSKGSRNDIPCNTLIFYLT